MVAGLYPFVAYVNRPPPKYAEGLAGAVQKDSEARELKYFVQGEDDGAPEAEARPRQRAFLHPSSVLFKELLCSIILFNIILYFMILYYIILYYILLLTQESSYSCPYVVFSERLVQQQQGNSELLLLL